MKLCRKCQSFKDPCEFSRKQGSCKSCVAEAYRERYARDSDLRASVKAKNKQQQEICRRYVFDYLTAHSCTDCGEDDPIVLEFDHVRGKKSAGIAVLIRKGASMARLTAEIAKCEVVCANCHRRRTALRANWGCLAYISEPGQPSTSRSKAPEPSEKGSVPKNGAKKPKKGRKAKSKKGS